MNKLQAAQERFHSTRVEAIAAYKKWANKGEDCDKLFAAYTKAWQEHQEASMALFLLEVSSKEVEQ